MRRADRSLVQALVAIVMLSELLCVAISFEQCVHYGIAQDRSLPTLLFFQPIDAAPSAASGTTAVIVQLYLARRAAQLFINRPVAQRIFRVTASVLAILAWLAAISVSVLYALVVGGHATFNGVDAIYTTNIMFGETGLPLSARLGACSRSTFCQGHGCGFRSRWTG